jgi:argininosuccinate lyase
MKRGKAKPRAKDAKQTFWGGRMKEAPEQKNVAYCAGRDVAERPMADAALVPYDVWQNRAHTLMLAQRRIMPKPTARQVLKALTDFEKRAAAGTLALDPRKEDVHTNIEHFVASVAGEDVSGFMHTGRSRNDQTTTVVRMCVRERLLDFGESLVRLVRVINKVAAEHRDVPVTGFTHYQPASLTTIGHWFASHAQALTRDVARVLASYDRINISPLGAAASFGTSWPIDRALTARLLGFDSVQANTLDCVTNRWEMEADAANAVAFALTHLSIVAQDLIMLSLPQSGIVEIADRYVTGSSIMPQKRNPDFAEVTRAKAAVVQSQVAALMGIARGALSGYNRDTQWTKYLVLDILDEAAAAPDIFAGVFGTLKVNRERAAQSARENFVDAVDVADTLARDSGLPFRAAYEIVSRAVRLSEGQGRIDPEIVERLAAEAGAKKTKLEISTPERIVAAKDHDGGPAPKAVDRTLRQIAAAAKEQEACFALRRRRLEKARNDTAALERQLG